MTIAAVSITTSTPARRPSPTRQATDPTTTADRSSTSSAGDARSGVGVDLHHITGNQMQDFTWQLRQSGQISDDEFFRLNSPIYPWDPSVTETDVNAYMKIMGDKPMDRVRMLESDIDFATGEEKASLRNLLSKIERLADGARLDTSV